jgi:hypothetical protein
VKLDDTRHYATALPDALPYRPWDPKSQKQESNT